MGKLTENLFFAKFLIAVKVNLNGKEGEMLFLVSKWRLSSSFFYWKRLDCGLIQANSEEGVAEKMSLEKFANPTLQGFYFKKQAGNSAEKIIQAAWKQEEIIGYEIYPVRELTEPI